jgi:hypothetical protein
MAGIGGPGQKSRFIEGEKSPLSLAVHDRSPLDRWSIGGRRAVLSRPPA